MSRRRPKFRGLYIFLHNADCERDWFTSREHWERYFDLLAASRYNSFSIVMAHQTSYLAPPFPFFVDVPEHPEVTVPGLSAGERSRNLDALNMIADLAGARGLDFVVGIWEVIAWKRETKHGTHTQKSMVAGLDWGNLESYTYHATRRLLAGCPGIKGIQLRVNAESGVPPEKQTVFFTNTIFRAIREAGRPVLLDLRGWIAHPQTIEAAKGMGIPMRLSMKYWAEHLGAPYQAAHAEPGLQLCRLPALSAEVPHLLPGVGAGLAPPLRVGRPGVRAHVLPQPRPRRRHRLRDLPAARAEGLRQRAGRVAHPHASARVLPLGVGALLDVPPALRPPDVQQRGSGRGVDAPDARSLRRSRRRR